MIKKIRASSVREVAHTRTFSEHGKEQPRYRNTSNQLHVLNHIQISLFFVGTPTEYAIKQSLWSPMLLNMMLTS